jgi:glucosamine-6-phosphate deaminase
MEVVILASADEAARAAARVIARLVAKKRNAVLGLATGRTQEPVYAELVRLHRDEGLDFRAVTTFNLDEYVGIAADHPGSYRRYMQDHFFRHVKLSPGQTHVPDGLATDIPRTCQRYEEAIGAAGGIDLQLLGLGADGHIGFNEPSSSLASRTRLKTLAPATLAGRPGFDSGDAVPRHVITMGVGTILEARRCLMLATGGRKADAVAKMIEGPITAMVPGSALQLHARTTVLLDDAAAGKLALADYYREVHRNKPEWQRQIDGE